MNQKAVETKGKMIANGDFLKSIVLDPAQLHAGHGAPDGCLVVEVLM
jgi:hypothetical protein